MLENRGLEEQGIYRVVGVTSKVNKLLNMGLDRRKCDKLSLDDPQEWETKTITSALKNYLRNLPEPLMTYKYHNGFIAAVSKFIICYNIFPNSIMKCQFFILCNGTCYIINSNYIHITSYIKTFHH